MNLKPSKPCGIMVFMLEKLEALLKAIKSQAIDPSIKQITPASPKTQIPGVKPLKLPGLKKPSKKDPVKQAEQVKDKSMKDQAMQDAASEIKIEKSTGQWKIEKSGYKGYTNEDNIKRKAKNIEGEKDTGIKTMNRTKKWTAPKVEASKQKEMKDFNRKSKVKEWSKEHGWHFKEKGKIVPVKDQV